ncbi:MAG: hypothetical protein COU08_02660 [Candidatus Harrisonbacteria bacterium CG10_big_fil_rev_8_21_14_0_10_42_17]|uniref:Uncharacterized protein n=1 Tax=Candidatus Harrisonbacteria bacterium CG10_big_fil_rev_8_21_14_0_10_42_17 TaxID=1974584 RepID=A0A2M6WHY2_9BACT|nr:MAG: hypothetical protein COU08_02660 [Candidatus Harrisonbacteria bacterium CG10_big_fil_rev_8_21_14_0_10_42_17]
MTEAKADSCGTRGRISRQRIPKEIVVAEQSSLQEIIVRAMKEFGSVMNVEVIIQDNNLLLRGCVEHSEDP